MSEADAKKRIRSALVLDALGGISADRSIVMLRALVALREAGWDDARILDAVRAERDGLDGVFV